MAYDSGNSPLNSDEIAALIRREEILDEFESAWRGHSRPAISEFLQRVEAFERPQLLKELLCVEWDYRTQQGETPNAVEYEALFPEHVGPIAEAIADFITDKQPGTGFTSSESTATHHDVSRRAGGRVLPSEPQHVIHSVIGQYEIQTEIGRGGMGVVYRARHLRLNRIVALKVIRSGQHADADEIRRFQLEAVLAAQLDHPGIVPVYEAGEFEGQPYIAMGFVEGQSLWQRIQRSPLPPRDAARLIQSVAVAVQFAHEKQIIHRDIKPQNVLVSVEGQARITDFGLAKLQSTGSDLTATGQIVGTPSYMPPEQAAGRSDEIGPRTDVYSLGATLYCALTGRPPFQTANAIETLRQVQEQEPVSPRVLNPAVERDLATICLKCLQKDPAHRYDSAAAFAADLQRYLRREPIRARPVGWLERSLRWCRRNPFPVALITSFVLLLALSSLTVWIVKEAASSQLLAKFSDDFERLMDHPKLTTDYVAAGETLIAPIVSISPSRAATARERLWTAYAELIESHVNRSHLTGDDERQLQQALERLHSAQPKAADRLRKLVAARLRNWQTVFEIAGPFTAPPSVLSDTGVTVREGRLGRVPVVSTGPQAAELPVVQARDTAKGKVRWELQIDASAPQISGCGCEFQFDENSSYRFVVNFPTSQTQPATGSPARDSSQALAARQVTIQILRNKVVLRELVFPEDGLIRDHLGLIAERDGDLLSFQVGNLPRLEFYDVFAIRSSSPVHFGIVWPVEMQLIRAKAQWMPAAALPSPLEHGDDLYSSGQFKDALDSYRRVQRDEKTPQLDQENRYKQAVCLHQLARTREAIEVLETLSTEPGQRWPAIAAVHLWLLYINAGQRQDADRTFDQIAAASSIKDTAALIPENLRSEIMQFYRARHGSRLSRTLVFDPQLIKRLERQIQLEEILGNSPLARNLAGIELINAEWAAGNQDRCWKLIDDLYAKFPAFALQVYMQSHFKRGHPEVALAAVDERIYQKNGRLNSPVNAWLWLRRAECHARLGNWESAEQDLAELNRSASHLEQEEVMYITFQSALLHGWLLEMRGDHVGAVAAWRKGIPADPRLRAHLYMPAEYIFLRALSGDLDSTDCDRLIDKLQGDSSGSMTRVARGVVSPETLLPAARSIFQSRYGQDLVWRMASGELFDSEVTQLLVVLSAFELVRQGAFHGQMTPEQEDLLYSAANDLYRAYTRFGRINVLQAGQAALAWKGNIGVLGWGGLAATLTPDLRGPLAYIVAHRVLARAPGTPPEQIRAIFRTALTDAAPESLLSRLAARDLELLSSGSGLVHVHSSIPVSLRLDFLIGDAVQKSVVIEHSQEIELPIGEYQLRLHSESTLSRLSTSQLTVTACSHPGVSIDSEWKPSNRRRQYPGIIPAPADRPEISRWQVARKRVRGPIATAALTPDGTNIAIGDQQGIVRIHSLPDGQLQSCFPGHRGLITQLAWSADGQQLASAGSDNAVRTWNVSARSPGFVVNHRYGDVRVLSWRPKQRALDCGFWVDPVTTWNNEGIQQGQLAAPVGNLLVWNPAGDILASHDRADIHLTTQDGIAGPTLKGHTEPIISLAWSFDNKLLASSAYDRSIRIWQAGAWTSEQVKVPTGDLIQGLAWHPQSAQLACGVGQGNLSVFRYPGLTLAWQSTLPGKLQKVQWSADGQAVLSTVLNEKTFSVMSSTATVSATLQQWNISPVVAALNRSGSRVLIYNSDTRLLELWRSTGQFEREISNATGIISSNHAWSPDDRLLAIPMAAGEIGIFDGDSGTLKKTISGIEGGITEFRWRDDSQALAILSGDRLFVCFAGMDWKPSQLETGHPIRCCGWKPGTEWLTLLYGDDPSQLHFLNAHTGKVDHSLGLPANCVNTIGFCWCPDAQRMAFRTAFQQIWITDHELRQIAVLKNLGQIQELLWSPDSKQLLALSTDGSCQLWGEDWKQKQRFQIAATEPAAVWSTDSRRLTAWSSDSSLFEWDAVEGRQTRATLFFPDHQSVTFGAGGNIEYSTENAFEHFVCLQESRTGTIEIVQSADFYRVQPSDSKHDGD